MEVDELEQEEIRMNPVNRCYLCKRHLFMTLKKLAGEKGVRRILDGTNEDDMHVYRPGIRALKELGIISPLAELHITKEAVKGMASEYGISVASRPSTPCMATRLPYNTRIDYDVLDRIAQGEADMRADVVRQLKGLGFTYVALDLEGFRSGSMDVGITEVHGSADPSGAVPL